MWAAAVGTLSAHALLPPPRAPCSKLNQHCTFAYFNAQHQLNTDTSTYKTNTPYKGGGTKKQTKTPNKLKNRQEAGKCDVQLVWDCLVGVGVGVLDPVVSLPSVTYS